MKSRTSIKTRLLALVLTVLMTVGVLPFSVFALDGVATTDRLETDNAIFKAPTGEEIKEALGSDGTLLYYNNYNVESVGDIASNAMSDNRSRGHENHNGVSIVKDANGNGASLYSNTSNIGGAIFITQSSRRVTPANQGKNFVVSADYRLDGAITAGQLLVLNSWRQNTSGGNAPYTAIPLWIDKNGNVYVTNDKWTAADTEKLSTYAKRQIGTTVGGCVWGQNGWAFDGNLSGSYKGIIDQEVGVIATLTTDSYVNLTVQVKDNKWMVYVDGVQAFDEWKVFMSESCDANYANDASGGYDAGKGFALCSVSHHYADKKTPTTEHLVCDNIAIYFADKFVGEGGREYDSSLTASDLAANPAKSYKTDAAYWQEIPLFIGRNLSVAGSTNTPYKLTTSKKEMVFLVNNENIATAIKNLYLQNKAGLDVAWEMTVKVSSQTVNGKFGYISSWDHSSGQQIHLVTLTKTAAGVELRWGKTQWNADGELITMLNADEEYKLSFLYDVDNGKGEDVYIYIDGVYMGKSDIYNTVQGSTTYSMQNILDKQNTYADSSVSNGYIFNGIRPHSGGNIVFEVSAPKAYYYDDDADGSVTDSERKINVEPPTLLHYNDFNNQTVGASPNSFTSLLGGSLATAISQGGNAQIVDDGRGGKAFTYDKLTSAVSGFQTYYQVNGVDGGAAVATANSGKSFVISADVKLRKATEGGIIGATAWGAYAGEYGRDFNVGIIYTKADGGIYISHKTDGNESGVYVNDANSLWKNTAEKIGYLNTTCFTNIAVAVNVAANTYKVYINGVDATGDRQFLTTADKEALEATDTYPNGFGLSYSRINLMGGASTTDDAHTVLDNIACYLYSDIVKPNETPLNGYFKKGTSYYYFNNGNIATNFTSKDGILTAGIDGVVKLGADPVTSINDIYKYVGNDVVPVDGVFSGVYGYVKSANYYCYDGNKNLIKGVAVYDAITAGTESDDRKTVGFTIDTYGVATPLNGYIEVAPGVSYYYINGVRTTGLVKIGYDYYFIDDNYNIYAGYKTVEGKLYYFNEADDCKGGLVNGVHAGDAVTYKYYVDGVALTGGMITVGNTKYFADADGKLLSGIQVDPDTGNSYFFYSETNEKKFQMAVGESVIWNGSVITIGDDGIINAVDGKVFDRWTYIDGEWYYSDASGNLANGFAYLAKDEAGEAGGYYYFVDGKPVTETFVDVYGTLIYFHEDGKAPNGVTFVKYSATNFPGVIPREADGEYMYFINGVLPTGATEAIYNGSKYSFLDGRAWMVEELDENNPEILITIYKDGRADSFYFNSEDDGVFNMLLTNYPCYTITVYDITTGTRVAVTADAQTGRYALEGEHTYEIRYDAVDHTFGTEPVKTVGATCGANGYIEYACTVPGCVKTHKAAITERPAHDFSTAADDITVIRNATCVKAGIGVTWCKNGCGESHTLDIPATGEHAYAEVLYYQASTCTVGGYMVLGCTMCDAEIHGSLDLADHVFTTYVDGEKATCVAGGTKVATCDVCGEATDTIATPRDYDNHVHGNDDGTLNRYDEECASYFELFSVVAPSTCLEEGVATFRCKDCGGFVYEVAIELDPDNHHYNEYEEYLAVLDRNGEVIETVKIVGGKVIRDGEDVADEDSTVENRLEMLSYSLKICGYEAEWRIDCKSGCLDPDTDAVFYTVVEEVEGTFLHSFDLSVLYTTTDETDPLYGYHYYKCTKCNKAAGATAHEMIYTDNNDGTHNYTCSCVDEATNEAYGEFDITCTFETKFDENGHWTECVCGAKTDILAHTAEAGYDANEHWTVDCDCGYNDRTAHTWGDVDGVDSTCYATGYTDHKACDCGAKQGYEVVGMKAHSFSGELTSDENMHWYACSKDGCTFKYKETAHNYITVEYKAPTCQTVGYEEYHLCADCGYSPDYVEIEIIPHTVSGPYSYDEEKHWRVCSACSTVIAENHTLGELLSDEEGTKQCGVCEHIVVDLSLTWWKQLGLERVDVEGHYYYTYGETANALVTIQGDYYYFDANGYLVMIGDSTKNANAKDDNGTFDSITVMGNTRGVIIEAIIATADGTFYISGGAMQTGWKNVGGKDYYFNSELGEALVNADLAEGALVKAAEGASTITALNIAGDATILVNVAADGARLLGAVDNGDGTASYYLDGTAGKLTGRIEDTYYNVGKIYFANSEGILYTGTNVKIYDGAYYNFHDTEYYVTEWLRNKELTIGGDTIYTDGDGKAIDTGWFSTVGVGGYYIIDGVKVVKNDAEFTYKQIGNYYYAFDDSGMASYYTGWNDENTLYISSGNVSVNRFEVIGGNKYYFDGNGQIVKAAPGATVLVYINSFVYEMDENGVATQYDVVANGAVWINFLDANGVVDTTAKGYYTSTGLIKSQAIDISGFTYIFDAEGKLVVSQDNYLCNDVYYIIDAEGKATVKEDEE